MKKIIIYFVISMVSIISFSQKTDLRAFRIFDSNGKEVLYSDMIDGVQNADVLFFGELHNNPISHWFELKLTQYLYQKYQQKFKLGAEMFESDNQLILNEYLDGFITDKSFESECRTWPNYKTDYKPIIEFAKANKIQFIATNIPRRYANIVYKKDFNGLDFLSRKAKKYIAPLPIDFDPTVECYKEMIDGMKGMGGHGGETIAKAQAIKDATMAYFILKNFKKGNMFFHFNGSYHSDNYQGICWYLKKADKRLKIKTISTVSQDNIDKLNDENKGIADFIICVPSDMTTTY